MLTLVNKTSARISAARWQRIFNKKSPKADVAVILVGEAYMQRISRAYHGKKTATVLTFLYEDSADLVLNVVAARGWAKKYDMSLSRVLEDWFIHALSYVS